MKERWRRVRPSISLVRLHRPRKFYVLATITGVLVCLLIATSWFEVGYAWSWRATPGIAVRIVSVHAGGLDIYSAMIEDGVIPPWLGGFQCHRVGFHWTALIPRDRRFSITGTAWGSRTITIPLWIVVAPFAIWTIVEYRRACRRSEGRCPGCLYDLAGTDADVCPECGRSRVSEAIVRVEDIPPQEHTPGGSDEEAPSDER